MIAGSALARPHLEGTWENGLYVGGAFFDDYGGLKPDPGFLIGARVGYFLSDPWSLEAAYHHAFSKDVNGDAANLDAFRLNVLYHFDLPFRPFLIVGGLVEHSEFVGLDKYTIAPNFGAGGRWPVSDWIGLRLEARYIAPKVAGAINEKQHNFEILAGISFFLDRASKETPEEPVIEPVIARSDPAAPQSSELEPIYQTESLSPTTERSAATPKTRAAAATTDPNPVSQTETAIPGTGKSTPVSGAESISPSQIEAAASDTGTSEQTSKTRSTSPGALKPGSAPAESASVGRTDSFPPAAAKSSPPSKRKSTATTSDSATIPRTDVANAAAAASADATSEQSSKSKSTSTGAPKPGSAPDATESATSISMESVSPGTGGMIGKSDSETSAESDALLRVGFALMKAELAPEAQANLDAVAGVIKRNPGHRIEVQGHCDDTGEEFFNDGLSEARAKAVKKYLVEKGVDADQISSKGYGESRPIADNSTREGRIANRRAVLEWLK